MNIQKMKLKNDMQISGQLRVKRLKFIEIMAVGPIIQTTLGAGEAIVGMLTDSFTHCPVFGDRRQPSFEK